MTTVKSHARPRTAGVSRRSFLATALAGGAAYVSLARDMSAFAQAGGPIVIGHHCELTGGFASWGYWHNKCALAAVKVINESGGIAGRRLDLVTEDTESNPAAGVRKLRSLIQRNRASFITGSVHSGIMLASIPVATELKTIYFSTGEATEATGEKGTRYSFRTGTDTYGLAAAGAPWAYENLGKRWTIISPDYAWGHSHYKEHKAIIEKLGGTVNDPIYVPLDARDLIPYLTKIPQDTEVLFSVFFGALSIAFYTQAKSMGLERTMKMYSVSGTIEAIAPADLKGAAENVYIVENFPRMVKYKDDEYHRKFIELIGTDDVHAREVGSDRVNAKSHSWQSYENLFALKQAIEKAGWKTKKDDPAVIEALEGLEMPNSLGFAQGAKVLRKEDHSGIIDCYISQVRNDELHVIKKVTKEELVKHLPVRFDLTKQSV
jgi:branched-chain amino acid transport system substrate-binding protein